MIWIKLPSLSSINEESLLSITANDDRKTIPDSEKTKHVLTPNNTESKERQ